MIGSIEAGIEINHANGTKVLNDIISLNILISSASSI